MKRERRAPPSVSAIIPLYNGAAHIEHALRSVFAQTQLPDEVIVVDDGSTDDSAATVQSLLTDGAPIPVKVVTQANRGQSAARNEAATIAAGELLAFLDQDDTWHPRHLARLCKPFANRPSLGWTYSDFDEVDGAGHTVTQGYISTFQLPHPKHTLSQFLMSDLMMLPSAAVVRASAFGDVGGFDPDLCGYEDDDLFIRLFRAGWGSAYVNQPLARFRVHDVSASASGRFRRSRILFLDKLERDVADDHRLNRYYIRDLVVPRLYQVTLSDYATALRCGDIDEALSIVGTIEELDRRNPAGLRRAVELWLLRRPVLFKRLLAVHRAIPRPIRPRINEALRSVRPLRGR